MHRLHHSLFYILSLVNCDIRDSRLKSQRAHARIHPMKALSWLKLTSPLICASSLLAAADFFTLEVSPQNPYKHIEPEATEIYEQGEKWSRESPTILTAHPSAKHFPGLLKEGYKTVKQEVSLKHKQITPEQQAIDMKLGYSRNFNLPNNVTHYSTGLYAPAGTVITITAPPSLIGKASAQIGIHTDKIPNKKHNNTHWRRMSHVTNTKPLDAEQITITSPFGGPIYINIDPKSPDIIAKLTIEGATPIAHYKDGKTSLKEWHQMLEQTAAPWGEFETDNLIITMSTEGLKKIKNPVATAQLWSDIIGACYDLAQIPQPFYRKQRIVLDEQIALGLMHSGYPIMAHHREGVQHYESEQFIYNPETLDAAWGFFHEIGHNMQNHVDWVFSGTTEVSVNFFSLYIYDQIIMGMDRSHTGVSAKSTRSAMNRYFARGAHFEEWKKDPFLGLILFRQIRNEFGWDVYKKLFARFNESSTLGVPCWLPCNSTGDARKIDNWVYHLSDITQRDLAPFFQAWGIPVSPQLAEYTKKWRMWMPYHFHPELMKKQKEAHSS